MITGSCKDPPYQGLSVFETRTSNGCADGLQQSMFP